MLGLAFAAVGPVAQLPPHLAACASDDPVVRERALAELRQQLDLPPSTLQRTATPVERRRSAMRAISAGLQQPRGSEQAPLGLGPMPELFATAAAAGPDGIEALLALAVTAPHPWLARVAVTAIPVERLREDPNRRIANLLLLLLDDPRDDVAMAAFVRLTWLLDALPPDRDVEARIATQLAVRLPAIADERASVDWPRLLRVPIGARAVLPFPAPLHRDARLLALAAQLGHATARERLGPGAADARFVLHGHALRAPHADGAAAEQWFRWYAPHVERWQPDGRSELYLWQAGVLTTLVGVLPQLAESHLAWFEQHLGGGPFGAAAAAVAAHRLIRIAPTPGRDWLDLDLIAALPMAPLDLLRLWRALGSCTSFSLDDVLAVTPRRDRPEVRAAFLRHALAAAPRGDAAVEQSLLAPLHFDAEPSIALAAVRRTLRCGTAAHSTLDALVDALVEAGRAPLALEVALELGPARGERLLPVLHGEHPLALVAQASTPLRDDLLAAATADATGTLRRSLLRRAATQESWSAALQRFVALCTTQVGAEERLLAYRALANLDPRRYAVAALRYECHFARDVDLRRLAGR